jgi:chemotaxis protein MotC
MRVLLLAAAGIGIMSLVPLAHAGESQAPAPAVEAASPGSHEPEPSAAEVQTADDHAASEEHAPGEQDSAPRPPPGPEEQELVTSIKMFFAAQDAVAAGHDDAKALQGALLAMIASKHDGKNPMSGSDILADYLAGYLLSGGDTRLVESLAVSSHFGEAATRLLNSCVLYRKGRRDEAASLFESVDLALLSATVLGRVALARAVLTEDPASRERLLSIAIASMPGTLVEEGALRRSALGFSESGDNEKFWARVDRYTRRFPRSSYLPEFVQQVAGATARFAQRHKTVDAFQLDRTLTRLRHEQRMKAYLSLARLASSRHTVALVDYAASRLERIAVPGSQEEQIALVYRNAYRLLEDGNGAPRQALKSLDAALLPDQERKLLQAALAVSAEIDAPLEDDPVTPALAATPVMNRAQTALQNADKLLQESL